MRRTLIRLEEVAEWSNLLSAVHKAARGKHARPDVAAFLADLPARLAELAESILDGRAPLGQYRSFIIRDPKRRLIHAAAFPDRVLHHGILNLAEPVFEKALVSSSYACRPGKGVHRAVAAVQRHLQRYRWYAKIDVDGYFPAIPHPALMDLLARRFKGAGFLALLQRIIQASPGDGCGLPIGSLTSQHFANLYLDSADRLLLNHEGVRAHVRYMDDVLWWADSADVLRKSLSVLDGHLQVLGLTIKPSSVQIQPSELGVSYCGFRIRPGLILPSRRKLRRYRQHYHSLGEATRQRLYSEGAWQRRADAIEATLAHCTSLNWRRRFWAERVVWE